MEKDQIKQTPPNLDPKTVEECVAEASRLVFEEAANEEGRAWARFRMHPGDLNQMHRDQAVKSKANAAQHMTDVQYHAAAADAFGRLAGVFRPGSDEREEYTTYAEDAMQRAFAALDQVRKSVAHIRRMADEIG